MWVALLLSYLMQGGTYVSQASKLSYLVPSLFIRLASCLIADPC